MIKNIKSSNNWIDVLNAARIPANKPITNKEPTSEWKRKALISEHSMIRLLTIQCVFEGIPYYVAMHFKTHSVGTIMLASTQRTDRTNIDRNSLPQNAKVNLFFHGNAQSLINISRKRFCFGADSETIKWWRMFNDELRKIEPELAEVLVRECVYRGHCPEPFGCNYVKSPSYFHERNSYLDYCKNNQ